MDKQIAYGECIEEGHKFCPSEIDCWYFNIKLNCSVCGYAKKRDMTDKEKKVAKLLLNTDIQTWTPAKDTNKVS